MQTWRNWQWQWQHREAILFLNTWMNPKLSCFLVYMSYTSAYTVYLFNVMMKLWWNYDETMMKICNSNRLGIKDKDNLPLYRISKDQYPCVEETIVLLLSHWSSRSHNVVRYIGLSWWLKIGISFPNHLNIDIWLFQEVKKTYNFARL